METLAGNLVDNLLGVPPVGVEYLRYYFMGVLAIMVVDYVFRLVSLPFSINKKK